MHEGGQSKQADAERASRVSRRGNQPGRAPGLTPEFEVSPATATRTGSPRSMTALQRAAGNRAARALAGEGPRSYAAPEVRVDVPAAAVPVAEPAREVLESTSAATEHVGHRRTAPADLVARWAEAQRSAGLERVTVPSQRSMVQRAGPTIRPGNKSDKLTMAGDAGAALTSAGKTAIEGVGIQGVGSTGGIGQISRDVLEFSTAAGEILGFVAIGLNVFSLGENLVRGWDAKIRLAAFTKAFQQLPEDDPLRPYLIEAAKQQRWEKNRRWARAAVTAAIIGLTIAALAVASGGALLLAIATVLAIGKTIETVRNYLKKRKAKKQQKAAATEMFDQAYAAGPESQTYQSFTELLGALNIPVPDPASNKFKKERTYAIDQLAPHLARSDDAIKEALPEQAEEFVARADAEADAQIAEVEAAAAAAGVDAAAQSQAGGGPDAEEAGEQEEEVAAPA
ncbi:MAG: hypothetical protein H6674_09430 [Dehalococcoidia bacterium]|nr:hypothetical protein [Dehalococcoidia bacterium]